MWKQDTQESYAAAENCTNHIDMNGEGLYKNDVLVTSVAVGHQNLSVYLPADSQDNHIWNRDTD